MSFQAAFVVVRKERKREVRWPVVVGLGELCKLVVDRD